MTQVDRLQKLRATYGQFFSPVRQAGIDVGDGWYTILDLLLQRLTTLLREEPTVVLEVVQITEKGGRIRFQFRMSGASDIVKRDVRNAVDLAVLASARCCERCADLGELIQSPPWRVRCAACVDLRARR
mgnify:CR=1 FL=1